MKTYQLLLCCFLIGFWFKSKSEEPDVKQKVHDAQLLVKAGIEYMKNHELGDACHTFSKNPSWRKGDLSIMVIRNDGAIFTNPDDHFSIWSNIKDVRTGEAKTLLEQMEHRSSEGGGWISYPWKHDMKYAYVEKFSSETEKFYLTVGFYPIAKEFQAKLLVTHLIDLLEEVGITKGLERVSSSRHQRGGIYLEVYTEDGTCMAHGINQDLVGKNIMDLKDEKGVEIFKQALEVVRTKKKGWITFNWQNARKRSYVKEYTNPETQIKYIIMAGYYPDINKNMVPKFVKKAASFLSFNGREKAITTFNNPKGEFYVGSLEILVLDEKGKILTKTYPNNTLESSFFQKLINKANDEGAGWVYGVDRFVDVGAYVDKVTVGGTNYYVSSIQYMVSKKRVTEHFVNSAAEFFMRENSIDAFRAFSDPDGNFYRGDQYLFVYDLEGRCLAHGDNTDFIQRNFIEVTDQKGTLMLEKLINIARKSDMGWTSFYLRNSLRYTYIRRVDKKVGKNQKSYIIGSGFWR